MTFENWSLLFHAASSFMYIEATGKASNAAATLLSPPLKPPVSPSSVCFISFWYNMYGNTIGSLRVSTNLTSPSSNTGQWCRNGRQSRYQSTWLKGLFWIQPNGSTFQVGIYRHNTADTRYHAVYSRHIFVPCNLLPSYGPP